MYTKKRFCFNKKPRPAIHPLKKKKKKNSSVFIKKRLRCKHCAQKQNQKTKEFRSWSNKSGLLCLSLDETDLAPSPTFHNDDLWPIETDRASEVIVSLRLRSSRSKFVTKAFPLKRSISRGVACHSHSHICHWLACLTPTPVSFTFSRDLWMQYKLKSRTGKFNTY